MTNGSVPLKHYPFTFIMILLSALVSFYSRFGADLEAIKALFITDFAIQSEYLLYRKDLPEVQSGQLWRLATPIFIHFGIIHLVFNMLWLWELGRAIEIYEGVKKLFFILLLFAVLPNLAQFWVSGPTFGGMSGVVYGLLGYMWVRGQLDKKYALKLKTEIMVMMLIWFLVCLAGLIGNVANTAHGAGLVAGMLLGALNALFSKP